MSTDPQCRSCACTPTLPCLGGCVWISEEPRLCSRCAGTKNPQIFAQVMQMNLPAGVVLLLIGYARAALRLPEAEGLAGTAPVQALVAQIEAQLVAGGALSAEGLALLHQLEEAERPRIVAPRNGAVVRMLPHSMGAA